MDAKLKTKHYFLCINFLCLSYSVIVDFLQLFFTSIRVAGTPTARLDDWHFAPDRLKLKLNLLGDTQPRQFCLKKPNKIIIDLPNTELGCAPNKQEFSGAVKSMRLSV